jgi:hypothetical protein
MMRDRIEGGASWTAKETHAKGTVRYQTSAMYSRTRETLGRNMSALTVFAVPLYHRFLQVRLEKSPQRIERRLWP